MIRATVALAAGAACLAGSPLRAQALPDGSADCVAAIERAPAPADGGAAGPALLGDVCPDVAGALEANAWGEALASAGARQLSADAFLELVGLVQRYAEPPRAAAPSAPAVDAIVAQLRPFEPEPALSVWQQILEWLREKLGAGTGGTSDRLLEWLRRLALPDAWVRPIVYAITACIVVFVVLIAVNELRHGGAFSRRGENGPCCCSR